MYKQTKKERGKMKGIIFFIFSDIFFIREEVILEEDEIKEEDMKVEKETELQERGDMCLDVLPF